ncbi:MAG TPA: S41 family peptidase [Saprospiraceae bacterium]|nr:S41 family peptidase [Saprospiraceae bacterium]HMQ82890.1 S41 family peptidase [Saprospiraceae bacterium]
MKRFFQIALVAVILATTFAALPPDNKYFEIAKNIEIFTNLYKEVNALYVDEVDPGHLMRVGIDAMVGSLDPFTNYISESEIEGYRFQTEGKYNGIGAISKKIGDYVTITELYEGQAADKSGIRPGDQIIAVDGKDAKGKTPDEVNEILRGAPDSDLKLTIRRPGEKSDFDVNLVRGEVEVPNVPYYGMLNDDIGYIALTTFTRDAGRNVADALRALKKDHPDLKGVVFDLRWNGGGLLNEAVNVSNVFIPKGELVVTTKGKVQEWDRSFSTLSGAVDEEVPVVVLINKRSASASEIVSGVLQDYDRGILLGQRSYGKGLVQNTRDIGYNAKLKLTTAKYYIPSGRCIQSVEYHDGEPIDIADDRRTPFKTRNGRLVLDGGGVKPDIEVAEITDIPIIKSLLDKDIIFNYVTQFCLKHDSIDAVKDFRFTQFDEFVNYVEKSDFHFETESEKMLKSLEAQSTEEGYELKTQIAAMQKLIEQDKKQTLQEYKKPIISLIEKEIASRYYYQTGKIQMGLRNDDEVVKAIEILGDKAAYQAVLKGKG